MPKHEIEVGDVVWYWQLDDTNKPRPSPAIVTDTYEDGRLSLFVMFSRFIGIGGGSMNMTVQRAPGGLDICVSEDMPTLVVNCWTRKPGRVK